MAGCEGPPIFCHIFGLMSFQPYMSFIASPIIRSSEISVRTSIVRSMREPQILLFSEHLSFYRFLVCSVSVYK